ncbi:MAG: tRNA pseudouridine(38-40) synthase TruA [Lachnospiraceae bacterium]|nr:tRNA pseudouridine(38-40) synthase TruA [Lachnospiraceae bacterium]
MMNYKCVVQYEGTRYQGWQRQDSTENTLQGKIEAILTKMCDKKVEIQASGRTDAGVHALGQVMNFHIETEKSPEEIMAYLNQYLPEDVAVISIEIVSERFHSRLNARRKTYCYRVLNSTIPHIFERRYVYQLEKVMDGMQIANMQRAADHLVGTHDFKAFTSTKKSRKSTVRTIEKLQIEKVGDELQFTYIGNGFLYHMVRIITGTLLEVGMGEKSERDIPVILEAGLRERAGALAPAKGLTLMNVEY